MTNFSSGLFIVKIRAESTRFLAKIRVIFPKCPDIWAHPDLSIQLFHIALHTAPERCQPEKFATPSFSAFLVVCDQDKKLQVGQQIL